MSIVSILEGVQGVRGHVGDGDLQHHQPLVRQRQHLDTVLVSGEGKEIWKQLFKALGWFILKQQYVFIPSPVPE